MTRILSSIFLASILSLSAYAQNHDAFHEMMKILDITEDNLGYKPKGYWTRYPVPQEIPYKILAFDDLFAEPYQTYDFVRNMALSVEDYLHPEYLKTHNDGLLKVSYYCGILNQTEQFRAYTASLWPVVSKEQPLLNAIKEIYKTTNYVFKYNRLNEPGEFPLIEKDLRKALKPIHPKIQKEVAKTVLNMLEAYRFQQIGMRNVDYKDASKCWRIRHLGETQFDGLEYYPFLEDAAQDIDMNSIYYAGLKLIATSERLTDSLIAFKSSDLEIDWKNQNLNIITPIGRIIISSTKNDVHEYLDAFLLIDLGGDDVYKGAVGCTPSLQIPVSLAIDLAGSDKYINEHEYLPSQGAAIFGAAMLLDMEGNDEYKSKRLSQGAAMLGFGILVDMDGDDKYDMWTSGQGAAYFGVGLAIDNKGNDEYRIWGDGQGYGGIGGVGTLINRTGDDFYDAEADTSLIYRSDYWHSYKGKHNYTYAQGSGVGRRGDITDGHSWAGGIIDLAGDDKYESGNWSLASCYWYGMGFVYDGGGNDKYKSTSWSMSAGAHFCIATLIDEEGNDEYTMLEKQSQGMGFAHNYTIAHFIDKKGDDIYKLKDEGLGYAINMSQVFFFDNEGDDQYFADGKKFNYGWNDFDKSNPPNVGMRYHLYSDQICLFADLKGEDSYKVLIIKAAWGKIL